MDRRPRRTRRARTWVIAIAIALLAAGLGGYLHLRRVAPMPVPEFPPPPPVAEAPAPPATEPSPQGAPRVEQTPMPEAPLPPLGESDQAVRELAGRLSSHPRVAAGLASESVVRRFVAVIDNLADGDSPRAHLPFLAPGDEFRVRQRRGRLYIDPQSYARYDSSADAFASLEPHACAELYTRVRPLVEQAYGELGRSDRTFDAALRQAMGRLLATPVVEGEIELRPKVTSYVFADETLEALSPAQKQLLRMGPRNVRVIQEHIRAIATALGMSVEEGRAPSR